MGAFPLAAMPVKVPPGDAVLGADHRRVCADERRESRRHGREAVRFEREQHHIDRANCGGGIGGRRAPVKISPRSPPPDSLPPPPPPTTAPPHHRPGLPRTPYHVAAATAGS